MECVEEIEVPPEASYRGRVAKLFEFEATNLLSPILARTRAIAEHAANYEKTGSMTLEGVQFTRPEVAKYELRKLAKWCTRVSDEFWKWHKEAPKCFATCPEGKLRNGPPLRKDSLVDKLHYGKCTDFFGCYGQNRQFQRLSQIEEGFAAIQEEEISDFLNSRA